LVQSPSQALFPLAFFCAVAVALFRAVAVALFAMERLCVVRTACASILFLRACLRVCTVTAGSQELAAASGATPKKLYSTLAT